MEISMWKTQITYKNVIINRIFKKQYLKKNYFVFVKLPLTDCGIKFGCLKKFLDVFIANVCFC